MPDPTPSEAILDWAKKQTAWRQDALRRILVQAFTKADEDECLKLLCAEHDIEKTTIKPVPLEAKHLPVRSSAASNLRLLALNDIANVNRLASDAALDLAPTGLTVIYGDNGSGKSGFVRILKKACRARDNEPILPDVFTAGIKTTPAKATFKVDGGGKAQAPINWKDDGKFSSDALARIAIFDSRCASVHVDGDNKLEVVPHNLDCFEKLAQVCDRLRNNLKVQVDGLEKQLAGALPPAPVGSQAATFLTQLASKTVAELAAASKWTAKDIKRLGELAEMLKDPTAEAQRCERIAKAITDYEQSLANATAKLSDVGAAQIVALRKDAKELREQANASAAAAFKSEPLPGVGDGPWRVMFDAAKDYSESIAFAGRDFPVTDPGSQCVLCQQELDDAARDRFTRFANFVTGAMNAKAKASESKRDLAVAALNAKTLIIADLAPEALAHLEKADKKLASAQAAYKSALLTRRTQLLTEAKPPLAVLPASPAVDLKTQVTALGAAAKEARALAAAATADAAVLKKEYAELLGRKLLNDNQPEIKRRIEIHQLIAKLQKAMKACMTRDISDQGSKLLKAHVSQELSNALTAEKKSLGLNAIPVGIVDHTPKGAIHHKLKLNGVTLAADTSTVLSEGEHRAVALAAFFAELQMYPGKDAIIIDDPVSSLDHVRRGKVAERLVGEAKDRQVIVFTHDLVFLSEVRFYAAKAQTPLRVIGIRRGAQGFGSQDPDGEPWTTKNLPGRRQWLIQQLANLKKIHAANSNDYEPQLRFFYDRLRESWEKIIEEKIFNEVVTRFQPQVQTQRLREAVIDNDIFTQVHFGMSAVSNYTGHDKAAAKGAALADPAECTKDLAAFEACLDDVTSKAKVADKTRSALTKAPKA